MNDLELTKNIDVDEEVHEKLHILKRKGKYRRVNDFIRAILKMDNVVMEGTE